MTKDHDPDERKPDHLFVKYSVVVVEPASSRALTQDGNSFNRLPEEQTGAQEKGNEETRPYTNRIEFLDMSDY